MENLLKRGITLIYCLSFLYGEIKDPKEGVEDLGCFGTTFDIFEENMVDYLHNKINQITKNGGLEVLKEAWKKRIYQHLDHPSPVIGISHATIERTWTIDPTLTIEEEIKSGNGELIAYKGQKINPLHHVKPEKGFIFIDGTQSRQINFSKKYLHTHDIVLINGSPLDIEEKLNVPVFFDQGGYLTSKYGIRAVPAFFSVEGDRLRLTEVPCDE